MCVSLRPRWPCPNVWLSLLSPGSSDSNCGSTWSESGLCPCWLMVAGQMAIFFWMFVSLLPMWSCVCVNVWVHMCWLSCFSRVRLFVTPWTAARQAPLSIGFSRQEYWSGLPCPPPGGLSDPGTEPTSHVSSLAGRFFTTLATSKAPYSVRLSLISVFCYF